MKFFSFSRLGVAALTPEQSQVATPTKPVTKVQLLNVVAKQVGIPKKDVEKVLLCYLDAITATLREGHTVMISGFGKFRPRKPRAGNCRNPINGKKVRAPQRKSVSFRPSPSLKQKLIQVQEKQIG